MRLVGHPEVTDEPWFKSGAQRAIHADEIDCLVASWIAERSLTEVMDAFEKAQAAVAPIYQIDQVMEDPQFRALESITEVEDPELGSIRMQNLMFRLSETPGEIRGLAGAKAKTIRKCIPSWALIRSASKNSLHEV